jgi:predicted secreted Zn-dependent protease
MRRPRAPLALALALALVGSACDATTTPPASSSPPQPATTPAGTARIPQPRSPAATPATILAVDPGKRPTGPWSVTFQQAGQPTLREVYILSAVCPEPTCDINARIQTYDGIALGSAVFRHADGTWRYEADTSDPVDCEDGFETVTNGATQASQTVLVIAGYRPAGFASITVDIRGTRTVRIEPVAGSSCEPATLEYVANGEATRLVAAGQAAKPPTISGTSEVKASYFGPGVTVDTYQVTGSSITQIIASIRASGPWSDWVKARAEAVTRAVPKYRFSLEGAGASCRIVIATRPAVTFVYTITLPRWSRPKDVDQATVRWWTTEIQRVAAHERHHVELFRTGATRLSSVVESSTCATVSSRLAAVARDIATQQCEFDLREYGTALGLSLASCVNQ